MGEGITFKQEKLSQERLAQIREHYENLGSQITHLHAEEREAGEEYTKIVQVAAESGRLVIERLSEASNLEYFDPVGASGPWPQDDWSAVDRGRARRLQGVRPKSMIVYEPESRHDSRNQPQPRIEFSYGQTQYKGVLSDIELHLVADEE